MPPPATWFGTETIDDDIVVDQEIQSLKCPITLTLLEKPVRNTNCVHVYSLNAIKELVRQGRGKCECPVAGCAAEVTMDGVREDKVMARKIREEMAREEERENERPHDVQELTEGMSEIVYEDDDIKFEG
jgi:E3 SUMO-protein ligase NSE2